MKFLAFFVTEKAPAKEAEDRPLALRPVPPTRSSSQPSVRQDTNRHEDDDARFKSRTLPRDMAHYNEYSERDRPHNDDQRYNDHREQRGMYHIRDLKPNLD